MTYRHQFSDSANRFDDIQVEIAANQQEYGVMSGLCITLDGANMTYDVAAGYYLNAGRIIHIAAAANNGTLVAPCCNSQVFRLRANGSGCVDEVYGCAAACPTPPELGGACYTILYEGTVTAGQTLASASTNTLVQGPIVRYLGWKGTDIASAACLAYPAGGGTYFDVTGSTAVTALPNAPAGVRLLLHTCNGNVTYTHNATSLILNNAANFTSTPGDVVEFVSEGCGNWREINRPTNRTAVAFKSTPTTITCDAVLTSDSCLVVPVAANTTYAIWGTLLVTSAAAADFKVNWSIPSGAANSLFFATGCSGQILCVTSGGGGTTISTTGSAERITFQGYAGTGCSAGCFALQWSQGTSNAGCTTLGAQSHFIIQDLLC